MNCKFFRLQLDTNEWEGGKPLSPALQIHLESCPACRAHFELHRPMLRVLENDPSPALPADFTAKILARLEPLPAPHHAKTYFNWKRAVVNAGYAFALLLALWVVYQNVNWNGAGQLWDSPFVRQIQQGLAAAGATELLQSLRHLLASIFSFIPTTGDLIEKTFGKEILPKGLNLMMVIMVTYFVAKASVLIESWLRRHGSS
jgi:hypothetical protein